MTCILNTKCKCKAKYIWIWSEHINYMLHRLTKKYRLSQIIDQNHSLFFFQIDSLNHVWFHTHTLTKPETKSKCQTKEQEFCSGQVFRFDLLLLLPSPSPSPSLPPPRPPLSPSLLLCISMRSELIVILHRFTKSPFPPLIVWLSSEMFPHRRHIHPENQEVGEEETLTLLRSANSAKTWKQNQQLWE